MGLAQVMGPMVTRFAAEAVVLLAALPPDDDEGGGKRVCPKAPPGAVPVTNELTAYVLWGVVALMGVAVLVALGAVVAGRLFSMPHASKVGVISMFVVLLCAMALPILPAILNGILGKGCV